MSKRSGYNHELLDAPEKMTLNHLFDIASLTKAIGTTTSIMLLIDKGLISVDDPVFKYIKAFNAPEGSFGHTGFTGTSIVVIPEDRISGILLINRQNNGLGDSGDYYNVNPVRFHIFKAVIKYQYAGN